MNALLVKGALFFVLLVVAALWDLRKREIPDLVPALILLCGFLCWRPLDSILGFILTGFPYLAAAVLARRDGFAIGGGDVKLMAACGFVLGVWAGVLQSILALLLAVGVGITVSIIRKKPFHMVKIPLAPCFCVGGILSFAAMTAALL